MAFNRPTLTQLVERVTADIETSLGVVGAALRNSFTKVFSKALGGIAHLLHGHLEWASRQIIPDTAEDEYLARWASIWGITRTAATFATRTIQFVGTNGIVIPEGTELVTSDGVRFRTTAEVTIAAGVASAVVRALTAGITGNAKAGTVMTLVEALVGVETEASVTAETTDGVDEETDAALLARLLQRIQSPPLGGAASDYEKWALEVSGVTRAWITPNYLGIGTVGICFVRDNDDTIFPSEGEVDEVSAYIMERRPIPAKPYVFAPTADEVDFSIFLNPDTAEIRSAIEAELDDFFQREGEPGAVLYLSRIREAISTAVGEFDHTLQQPSANIEPETGYLPVRGTITWLEEE